MKKIIIAIILIASTFASQAQQHDTCQSSPLQFRLGANAGILQAGYLDKGVCRFTDYGTLSLVPDLRFARHWGVMLEAGAGSSLMNNLDGNGLDYPTTRLASFRILRAQLTPYYEFDFGQWYLDLAAGASFRARFAYYGGTNCSFVKTGVVGLLVMPRIGYRINDKWDAQMALSFDRTIVDILSHYSLHPEYTQRQGDIALTFGASYRF